MSSTEKIGSSSTSSLVRCDMARGAALRALSVLRLRSRSYFFDSHADSGQSSISCLAAAGDRFLGLDRHLGHGPVAPQPAAQLPGDRAFALAVRRESARRFRQYFGENDTSGRPFRPERSARLSTSGPRTCTASSPSAPSSRSTSRVTSSFCIPSSPKPQA